MMRLLFASLLLACKMAQAQWTLEFPTQMACASAAASVVGSAGGTMTCSTNTITSVRVVVPAAPVGVNILAFGAVCNGTTNNSMSIASAIAFAKSKGAPVLIPIGVCAYGDVITLDGVKLIGSGDGSVLFALNPQRESIFLRGSGSEVRSLKLSGVKATSRVAPWEATRIAIFGASKWVVDSVLIDGSAAAGIQTAQSANNGVISNNRILGTLADSVHITDKASYITVSGNYIQYSGDDGIAVVSYRNDGGLSHHITARNNTVLDNKGGRSMSVVGGSDVLYENNRLGSSGAYACLYLAQENPYNTFGVHNIVARNNMLTNCGSKATGHAAVMLYSDGAEVNTAVTLERNDIAQNGQTGIRIFGGNTGINVTANRINGASPPLDITTPGVAVTPYVSGPVGPQ